MSNEVKLDARQVLFKEGQLADTLYLIKSGEILCLKSSKDRLIPVFHAKAEDIVGESAMIKGSSYGYSAISMGRVEMVKIPAANFNKVLKDSPSWLVDLTSTMISRFQNTANLSADNRAKHPAILSEEDFPSSLEVEFKKLLN